jgi:DNA polymerase delta subunit 3
LNTANDSLLNDYLSSHDAVPTFLVSGPLLTHSSLGQTQTTASQDAPPTQSLAHLSATQKVRIVNMDEQSEDGNSEAGEELEEELEAGVDAMEEDVESQQRRVGEGVARWGVVLVGQDELDGKRPWPTDCS